ncbi:GNAT family N-acetyltransferase [Kineococcus sp. SYSU DK002]|uniref:GNAT family N-acetyltransferase n=1 Tax=Kineococcus sp. SYSU DK002 TaxID=3383123 RepID=UPI003D7C55E8
MLTIHPASAADAPAAAAVLAEAFDGDRVVSAVTARRATGRGRLDALFLALLRSSTLAGGGVDLARTPDGSVAGVAVWQPPGAGHGPLDLARQAGQLPLFWSALGLRGLLSAARAQAVLASHRPFAAHWYLAQIGVRARARGLGVGSALLTSRLDRIDRAGEAAYLEASSPDNRRLYERHGFQAVGPVRGLGGARPTAMWRPAGAGRRLDAPAPGPRPAEGGPVVVG